jgi:hypothetical protein
VVLIPRATAPDPTSAWVIATMPQRYGHRFGGIGR